MTNTVDESLNRSEGCYTDFIEETFIKPIRTVTVVDDEYPTMDVFISGELSDKQKENRIPLKQLISICREPSNNWMLDVYDGIPKDTDGKQLVSNRLHNSDFLILDYHLNGPDDDKPGKDALEVLRRLASKPHFNLVAIYTKGYDGNIDGVIKEIVCSLQQIPEVKRPPNKLQEALDDWSIEEDDIQTKLIDSITDLDLLSIIKEYGTPPTKIPIDSHYISELKFMFDRKPENIDLAFPLLVWWISNQKILKLASSFGDKTFSNFGWDMEGNINWVHADQLFITVVGKRNPPDILPKRILKALTQWNPHPHKLILAKLRHEIDEQGIAIANRILDKQYVHAFWLEEILTADKDTADFKTWTILCKHWEELAAQTKKTLTYFTLKMADQLKKSNNVEEILKDFTKPNILEDRNKILLHANCFNCSKPIEGYHLATGHVLELKEKEDLSYWVCVTPACDLEPGQNKKSLALEGRIPITLLRLYKGASACQKENEKKLSNRVIFERALEKATSKKVLFLNFEDNDVCIFSTIVNIHGNSNPYLEDFFVKNSGKFNQGSHKLTLCKTVLDKKSLIYKETVATVVAQLRYEYALDLLLKTGECKSRIGLDFIGL
ncbi:response regulator receiver domain [Desulfococcaceae bacterium HSG9]|nr:response regulator receiver domain [Desulfococcaceae bacterium HSG9]